MDAHVRVTQLNVLSNNPDARAPCGAAETFDAPLPCRVGHLASWKSQPLCDPPVEPLLFQDERDLVDREEIRVLDHVFLRDVAEQGDLALDRLGEGAVAPGDDRIGLNPDRTQFLHAVLRRLRLDLIRAREAGKESQVDEERVLLGELVLQLAESLQEREPLDIAHRSSYLDDTDLRPVQIERPADQALDLVRDVRDDLDCLAEVGSGAFGADDVPVDLAGRDVVRRAELLVEKPLVPAKVEIGLHAVARDEDLPMFVGIHRPGVEVDVRVNLL